MVDEFFARNGDRIAESLRARIEDAQMRNVNNFVEGLKQGPVARIETLERQSAVAARVLEGAKASSARSAEDLERLSHAISGLLENVPSK